MNDEQRKERIRDARVLLDWLEQHPQVPLPHPLRQGDEWTVYGMEKPLILEILREVGSAEKKWNDHSLDIRIPFGTMTLDFYVNRSTVCERVVVGTEQVPEKTIPETVVPAHTKEVVQWRCSPLLSNGDQPKDVTFVEDPPDPEQMEREARAYEEREGARWEHAQAHRSKGDER